MRGLPMDPNGATASDDRDAHKFCFGWAYSAQIKSNLKNFYSAPYNNGRERLTKYIGLIIKCEVKYNIGVSRGRA